MKRGALFIREAALSPQRQLTLMRHIYLMAMEGSQFIIATHSPILLGLPGAQILNFSYYSQSKHFTIKQQYGIMEWVIEMNRFQISAEEYEAIKEAEKRTKDKRTSQRLRILMQRYEGRKVKEIAEITGMQIGSISQLCRRYKKQGLEEFMRNKYTSHRHALTEGEERAILSKFEKAAEAGQEVTAQEIKAEFDKVRGKDTGRGYIYMLLKRHGWRKVMPRPRHPKAANEEACEASKKLSPACWKPEKTCPRTRKAECD